MKTNRLLLKMAIEIVSFPIENGDFPVRNLLVYQRVVHGSRCEPWCWNMHTYIYPLKIAQFCR